ncbi:ankyrin repeat and SOCS box protein 9 isoform X2 [Latimeria chalumnae]|uniref:ankyrin repeat and SOCS box protein 9 isoform X2 n=1 Tax=Latimeria chalumnae TaxID=7897 RepID=UPI00313ACD2E
MDTPSEDKSAGRSQAAGASSYGDYITNSLMSDSISDWSPVHDAAIHGRLLTLRRLISQGTSVNLLTADQVSPLHEACLGGHAACAKLLVENGAKVNRVAVDWNTPLFNACRSGSAACVNLLLQHGARPQTEYELASPIHEAAKGGHTECVQSLASHGADIDLNIKHLGTPLYVACANQRLECVKKLLESDFSVVVLPFFLRRSQHKHWQSFGLSSSCSCQELKLRCCPPALRLWRRCSVQKL